MLAAVPLWLRCSPFIARPTLATCSHDVGGRLTVNIISSDFPGERGDSAIAISAHAKCSILTGWTQSDQFHGEIYDFTDVPAAPANPHQQNGDLRLFWRLLALKRVDLLWGSIGEFILMNGRNQGQWAERK